MKKISSKELNISGGVEISVPKIGGAYCQALDGYIIRRCFNTEYRNVGREYTGYDGIRYRNRICLNCGQQWSEYLACDGRWYCHSNSW